MADGTTCPVIYGDGTPCGRSQHEIRGVCRPCYVWSMKRGRIDPNGRPNPSARKERAQCIVVFDDGTRCLRTAYHADGTCKVCQEWASNNGTSPMGRRRNCRNGEISAYIRETVPAMTPGTCVTDWPYGSRISSDERPAVDVDRKRITAVRYAWFVLHGSWPAEQMNHSCLSGGACWNPHHVYDGTQDDNVRDGVERGEYRRGSGNAAAKLDEQKVAKMRARYAAGGMTMRRLAQEYGVGFATAQRAIRRETWRHVA